MVIAECGWLNIKMTIVVCTLKVSYPADLYIIQIKYETKYSEYAVQCGMAMKSCFIH